MNLNPVELGRLLRRGWDPNRAIDGQESAALHDLMVVCEQNPRHDRQALGAIAQVLIEAREAMLRAKAEPDILRVRLDDDAQRFVQTLTDSSTGEMLRRYPSEAQLAYARAVMAYLRAIPAKS